MRFYQLCFLALFVVFLILSVIFSVVLHLSQITLVLLLMAFPLAIVVAVFGSLSIREEEEE